MGGVLTAHTHCPLVPHAWLQNCKMKIVVAFAVLLLALVIFLLVCFSGGNCLKR
jgi:hypothetical protein